MITTIQRLRAGVLTTPPGSPERAREVRAIIFGALTARGYELRAVSLSPLTVDSKITQVRYHVGDQHPFDGDAELDYGPYGTFLPFVLDDILALPDRTPLGLPMGTKTLLFGAHQFILHPLFVLRAWVRLYGPPTLKQLCAIVLHDVGYWGCRNLDGPEGTEHPDLGAGIMHALFDRPGDRPYWRDFTGGHSRTWAAENETGVSPLMAADKLGTALYPRWLYAALIALTGEYKEYLALWIKAGTYPGQETDGAWAYAGHLQRAWSRFKTPGARVGGAYENEA